MNSTVIVFSPTCGGAKIADAIQRGIKNGDASSKTEKVNITKDYPKNYKFSMGIDDPVIFVVPVYGGHMPQIANDRLRVFNGNGRPAVLVAVYGNRAFENTLNELYDFAIAQEFKPVALAAFVGEHSYSNKDNQIAAGRPDATDLADAEMFGRQIAAKIESGEWTMVNPINIKDIPSPEESMKNFVEFVRSYQQEQANAPKKYLPTTDNGKCICCNACIEVCPTDAIKSDYTVIAERCIKCCACVKACSTGARTFYSPFAKPLSRNFYLRKSPVTLL